MTNILCIGIPGLAGPPGDRVSLENEIGLGIICLIISLQGFPGRSGLPGFPGLKGMSGEPGRDGQATIPGKQK